MLSKPEPRPGLRLLLNDSDRSSDKQEEQVVCRREGDACSHHQNRTDDERSAAAHLVRPRREKQGDSNIPGERQRQQQSDSLNS